MVVPSCDGQVRIYIERVETSDAIFYEDVQELLMVREYIVYLHVHNMFERGQITEDTCKYLTTDIDRNQLFYILPKIHKGLDNPPVRSLKILVNI